MPHVRVAGPGDEQFLWQMLYWAAHVDEDADVTLDDIKRDPDLIGHVVGFGRDRDLGVVAEIDAHPVGAAWLRCFVPDLSDFSVFVDHHTPELVVAVQPEHVGRGVGSSLLGALFELADDAFTSVVLSSRADNPAVRLYERFGFREIDRIVNRVGTESLKMIRESPRRIRPDRFGR